MRLKSPKPPTSLTHFVVVLLSVEALICPPFGNAQEAGECKVLEIRGKTAARLGAGDLGVSPIPVRVGDILRMGESIVTGKGSSVKVRYGDGSIILLDENTKAILLTTRRLIQIPTTDLEFGKVRAQVVPMEKKEPKKIYKFSVRTRTATLGVRGTDFIVNSGSSGGDVHVTTLDGVVDVGSSEEDLNSGNAIPVERGQSLQVAPGQPPRRESIQKVDTQKLIESEAKLNPLMGTEVYREPQKPEKSSSSPRSSSTQDKPQAGTSPIEEPQSGTPHLTRSHLLSFRTGTTHLNYERSEFNGAYWDYNQLSIWGAHIAWTPYLSLGRWLGLSGYASWMQLISPSDVGGTTGAFTYGVGAHLLIPFTRLEASFTAIRTQFNYSENAEFLPGGRIGLKYRFLGSDEKGVFDSIALTAGGFEGVYSSSSTEEIGELTLSLGFRF